MNWLLCLIISIISVTVVSCVHPSRVYKIREYVESNYWDLLRKYKELAELVAKKEQEIESFYNYGRNEYALNSVIVPEEGYLNITLDGVNYFSSPGVLECTEKGGNKNKFQVLTFISSKPDEKNNHGIVMNIRKHCSEDYYLHPDVIKIAKLKETYREQDFQAMKNWYKSKEITMALKQRIPIRHDTFSIKIGPFLLDLKPHSMITIPGVLVVQSDHGNKYFIVESVEETEIWVKIFDKKYMIMGKAVFALDKQE